jgi:hypothetical protein
VNGIDALRIDRAVTARPGPIPLDKVRELVAESVAMSLPTFVRVKLAERLIMSSGDEQTDRDRLVDAIMAERERKTAQKEVG